MRQWLGPLKELRKLCVLNCLDENKIVLDAQMIQIKALVDLIAQPLPPDANEMQVHQYARLQV